MDTRLTLIAVVAGVIAATAIGAILSLGNTDLASAQMSGHSMDSGSMGMSSGSGMSGGGSMQHLPGMIREQSGHGQGGDMPPQYCEPVYKTMSSVKGIRVSSVEVMDDRTLMVTLAQTGSMAEATTERITVVGGGGDLAGGVIIDAGWDNTTTVHLNLTGTGTIYDHGSISVHLFPYTG